MANETIIQQKLEYKKEEQEFSDIVNKFHDYYTLIEDFCEPFMDDEDKTDRQRSIEKVIGCFNSLKEFYKNPEEFVKIMFFDEFDNGIKRHEQYDLPFGEFFKKMGAKWLKAKEEELEELGKEIAEMRGEKSMPIKTSFVSQSEQEREKKYKEAEKEKTRLIQEGRDKSSAFKSKELNNCGEHAILLWALAKKASHYESLMNFFYVDAGILQGADSCRSKNIEDNRQGILLLSRDYDYKEDNYSSKVANIRKLQGELMEKLSLLEQKSWKDMIIFWFQNDQFSREILKNMEGSTNLVIEINDDFMYAPSSFILKASEKSSSSLKFEKEIIEYLRKDFRTRMGDFLSLNTEYTGYYACGSGNLVTLPKIFCFFEGSNSEILAMHKNEWGVEMTKSELDDKQKEECLGTIAYFLAHIHKNIPLSISKKGLIDISDYIHKRLDNPFFELKDNTKLKLSKNLTPVLECLVNAPYGIYKDAHPDNFLVNDNPRITVLDWEDKGFHPVYFDLVNFCEYSKFITCKEKEKWLKDYVQAYNSDDDNKDRPKLEYNSDFYLSYLNAVIYRSICFSSAWSKPHRGEYKKARAGMLNKAVMAVSVIKNNHTSYYNKYKNNYDSLEKTIKEGITQLS